MKRLEEQVTCEDGTGQRFEAQVCRNLEREVDDSQTLAGREAFPAGDLDMPPRGYHENTFQTRDGKTLRWVRGVAGHDGKAAGLG